MLKQINDLHIFRYSVTELGNVLSSRGMGTTEKEHKAGGGKDQGAHQKNPQR